MTVSVTGGTFDGPTRRITALSFPAEDVIPPIEMGRRLFLDSEKTLPLCAGGSVLVGPFNAWFLIFSFTITAEAIAYWGEPSTFWDEMVVTDTVDGGVWDLGNYSTQTTSCYTEDLIHSGYYLHTPIFEIPGSGGDFQKNFFQLFDRANEPPFARHVDTSDVTATLPNGHVYTFPAKLFAGLLRRAAILPFFQNRDLCGGGFIAFVDPHEFRSLELRISPSTDDFFGNPGVSFYQQCVIEDIGSGLTVESFNGIPGISEEDYTGCWYPIVDGAATLSVHAFFPTVNNLRYLFRYQSLTHSITNWTKTQGLIAPPEMTVTLPNGGVFHFPDNDPNTVNSDTYNPP